VPGVAEDHEVRLARGEVAQRLLELGARGLGAPARRNPQRPVDLTQLASRVAKGDSASFRALQGMLEPAVNSRLGPTFDQVGLRSGLELGVHRTLDLLVAQETGMEK
jgi:hypothetical protein